MLPYLFDSKKVIWFLINFFLKMGFIFHNPNLSHKWECRFMGNILNQIGKTDKRECKSDYNLSKGLLNTSKG